MAGSRCCTSISRVCRSPYFHNPAFKLLAQ
jgi:hypothetical protein